MCNHDHLKVLELFSGIGGMHYALQGEFDNNNGSIPFIKIKEVIIDICLFVHLQLVVYPVKFERQLT